MTTTTTEGTLFHSAIACPLCGDYLCRGKDRVYEMLIDRVFDPNGTPEPRVTYVCTNSRCKVYHKGFWSEHLYGDFYGYYAKLDGDVLIGEEISARGIPRLSTSLSLYPWENLEYQHGVYVGPNIKSRFCKSYWEARLKILRFWLRLKRRIKKGITR